MRPIVQPPSRQALQILLVWWEERATLVEGNFNGILASNTSRPRARPVSASSKVNES
jgi:hypothetical protein